MMGSPPIWNDDTEEMAERIEYLESRVEEMWERMKQFEQIMSTAFRLHSEGFRPGKGE